ncbi:MAG: LacI family DNA-binding transcriptional regulator [Rhodothermales bacterium]
MAESSPSKRKVTIYDVADKAMVAISTVSRVLNNASDVSEEMRERVMKVVDELQYRPSRAARTLAQQRVPTIALAIPNFTLPVHNELLKGIRDHLTGKNVDVLICDLGAEDPEGALIAYLKRGTVDGLLVAAVPITDELELQLRSSSRPVVCVGDTSASLDSYDWDHAAGARLAVRHLVSQGCSRIALIAGAETHPRSNLGVTAYHEALAEAELAVDARLVVRAATIDGLTEEDGFAAMRQLLDQTAAPDAVFALSDAMVVGARRALLEAGHKIPDEVKVVGYNDLKISRFLGLSSVDMNIQEMGHQATELLLRRMEGSYTELPVSVRITPQVRPRMSSGGA